MFLFLEDKKTEAEIGVFLRQNSINSSMAMTDILMYFAGDYEGINSLNSRVGIGNLKFNAERVELSRNESCKMCGQYE